MFGSIGPMELLIIFLIILIVFGAKKMPELARGLGKGVREFKKAAEEVKEEIMLDETSIDLDAEEPEDKKDESKKKPQLQG